MKPVVGMMQKHQVKDSQELIQVKRKKNENSSMLFQDIIAMKNKSSSTKIN